MIYLVNNALFCYKKERYSEFSFYAAFFLTILALFASATSLAAPALNRAGAALGGLGTTLLDLGAGAAIGAASGGGLPAVTAGANIDWNNRQLIRVNSNGSSAMPKPSTCKA